MAETTRQKLIHLHSANATEPNYNNVVSTLVEGEIAVAYKAGSPALLIKDSEGSLVEFIDKAAINNIVTGITGDITELTSRVDTLETAVSGLTDDLADEVARATAAEEANANAITANTALITAEETRAKAAEEANANAITAETSARTTADNALDTRIDGVETDYKAADTSLDNRIKVFEASGAHDVAALEGRVGVNENAIELLNDADNVEGSVAYAVKAEADRAKTAEKANADAITAETSSRESADESLGKRIDNVITAYTAADEIVLADAKSYTDTKVSSVYRYKGSVATHDDLPTTGLTVGDVYNVVAAYGAHPAGTNFAWTGSEWDALGGPVDLSTYALKTEVQAVASDLEAEVDRAISAETANATAISGETARATGAEKGITDRLAIIEGSDTVNGSIKKALKDAKAYTDDEVLEEKNRAVSAETANANAISAEETRAISAETALGQRIDAVESGMTEVKAANSGITVTKTDNKAEYSVGLNVDPDNSFLNIDGSKGLQVVNVAASSALIAVDNRVISLENTVGDSTKGLVKGLADEIARATSAETANATAISGETARATGAEKGITDRLAIIEGSDTVNGSIKKALKDAKAYTDVETSRATGAEQTLTTNLATLDGEVVKSGEIIVKDDQEAVISERTITGDVVENKLTFDFSSMVIDCGTF